MSSLPERPQSESSSQAIAVNSEGEAYLDFTRQKELIIVSEGLDVRQPVVSIDLETVVTVPDGAAVAIAVQDFGLPPRLIEIYGDFTDSNDVGGQSRDDEHYQSAPKKLYVSCSSRGKGKTYRFDDKGLPEDYSGPVELARGETMLFTHNGLPSDERSGYLPSDIWELIALTPKDYYGAADFSDLDASPMFLRDGFTPHIGISYVGKILTIYSLDQAHAFVLYQRLRSLDDTVPGAEIDPINYDSVGIDTLIEGLRSGDNNSLELLDRLVRERDEAAVTVNGLKSQLLEARTSIDNLETFLEVNKAKLRSARGEAAKLAREVERLKRLSEEPVRSNEDERIINLLFGNRHATESDPHGHCAIIGIDPGYLFSLSTDSASRYVRGVRKALVIEFHSDRGGDGEAMKRVNVAIDSILERIERGYWGRF